MTHPLLTETTWDSAAFGISCYELANASEQALSIAAQTPGHHTVRVDPMSSKRLLQEYGFYYTDTLIVPCCQKGKLRVSSHPDISIGKNAGIDELLQICHGAFVHGRFHRDFNLDWIRADARYDNWLRQMHGQQNVYGLFWRNELAGFIAYSGGILQLHAVAGAYRGKGLAKYWWSAVCLELFSSGHGEIRSSISAANLAVLNLYASLGFSFTSPQDIYHRMVK